MGEICHRDTATTRESNQTHTHTQTAQQGQGDAFYCLIAGCGQAKSSKKTTRRAGGGDIQPYIHTKRLLGEATYTACPKRSFNMVAPAATNYRTPTHAMGEAVGRAAQQQRFLFHERQNTNTSIRTATTRHLQQRQEPTCNNHYDNSTTATPDTRDIPTKAKTKSNRDTTTAEAQKQPHPFLVG